jgi:hypothetical protein
MLPKAIQIQARNKAIPRLVIQGRLKTKNPKRRPGLMGQARAIPLLKIREQKTNG